MFAKSLRATCGKVSNRQITSRCLSTPAATSSLLPARPQKSIIHESTFVSRIPNNSFTSTVLAAAPSGVQPATVNSIRQFSTTSRRAAEDKGAASSSSTASATPPLTESEYERISEDDMDSLHEDLEVLCEQFGPTNWEVEYSSGVMTVLLPPHGTYVINKQPPNLQIWISSPLSGPSRFDYNPLEKGWVHHRLSEVKLGRLLEEELRGLLAATQGLEDGEGEVEGDGWEGVRIR